MMSYIQVENLMKQYGKGEAAFMAVKGMSFQVRQGEFVAIVGNRDRENRPCSP
jgi:putative ABC transport system ATP-binding protein